MRIHLIGGSYVTNISKDSLLEINFERVWSPKGVFKQEQVIQHDYPHSTPGKNIIQVKRTNL